MSDPLAGWPFVHRCDVRWGDMDSYGHLNNTIYFRFFEDVRVLLLTETGLDRTGSAIGGILGETRCRFKAPVTYPDRVHTGGAVSEIGEDRFTMVYRLYSERLGRIAAEGDGTIVGYDYSVNAKAKLPQALREQLAGYRLPEG